LQQLLHCFVASEAEAFLLDLLRSRVLSSWTNSKKKNKQSEKQRLFIMPGAGAESSRNSKPQSCVCEEPESDFTETDCHEQAVAVENNCHEHDEDDYSLGSVDSNDTTMRTIQFQSLRDDSKLEQGISLVWPTDPRCRTLSLSTLLEPDDLAPLFAGAQWAGTRVWHAAIHGMFYMEKEYNADASTGASLLELGCGLGVPGMIWHMLGGNAVLSDQESIMSQLHVNLRTNFAETTTTRGDNEEGVKEREANTPKGVSHAISAHPLSWSRDGVHRLLKDSGYTDGFDYVLNCDCVYEPLYGKSWELLAEVIDELLKINPNCVVVSSVERRRADGIDSFVKEMKSCEQVGKVEQVLRDDKLQLEIYVTTGKP